MASATGDLSNTTTRGANTASGFLSKGVAKLSVRASLLLVLGIFVAGALTLSATNLISAWTSMSLAQTMRSNNDIGDLFLESAGAFGVARAVAASAAAGRRDDWEEF